MSIKLGNSKLNLIPREKSPLWLMVYICSCFSPTCSPGSGIKAYAQVAARLCFSMTVRRECNCIV